MKEIIQFTLSNWGIFEAADVAKFKKLSHELFKQEIKWQRTSNASFPFEAKVDDKTWKLRINDFTAEDLYTLFIEDKAVLTFNETPAKWDLPEKNNFSIH